jgi:hypothetical protein
VREEMKRCTIGDNLVTDFSFDMTEKGLVRRREKITRGQGQRQGTYQTKPTPQASFSSSGT